MPTRDELWRRLPTTAFAFRGYNVTNLGRSAELLAHVRFGSTVARFLGEAAAISSSVLGCSVDLVTRVRQQLPTRLETFAEDIALVVAMEQAQLALLEEHFGIAFQKAQRAIGYSLGEPAALVAAGVLSMEDALSPLLSMAADCAALAGDVTMGVLFSRGEGLDLDAVERLCVRLNHAGEGVIAISAILSPNSLLLLGQRDTVARFKAAIADLPLADKVFLRVNQHRWPPLHTPILWQRNIPNRAGQLLHTVGGGFKAPVPPIISLVTGKASYNDYNTRELLTQWIDHPQRLWDGLYSLLQSGVETVIHVGPEANLIPATFQRLSDNVKEQLGGRTLGRLGWHAVSGMVRRPWLSRVLASQTPLLRAPFLDHVILEDWLLEAADAA